MEKNEESSSSHAKCKPNNNILYEESRGTGSHHAVSKQHSGLIHAAARGLEPSEVLHCWRSHAHPSCILCLGKPSWHGYYESSDGKDPTILLLNSATFHHRSLGPQSQSFLPTRSGNAGRNSDFCLHLCT